MLEVISEACMVVLSMVVLTITFSRASREVKPR